MSRKLTFAVIFALAMCVLIVPAASTTFAADSPSTEYYNVQYGFSYEETVMPTKQIVRKYEKPTSFLGLNNTTTSLTKTKAILASLGMGEDFIDELSTERLNEYANSKSIIATTSYIKTTPEGVSTYITKQEAEEGSRAYDPPAYNDIDDGSGSNVPSETEHFQDNYMWIVFTVSELGGGRYHCSVDSEWLTNPNWFLTDTLGACMQNGTVCNDTRTGWYGWKQYEADDVSTMINVNRTLCGNPPNSPDCVFENTTNGNWTGSAAEFSYPSDNLTYTLHGIVIIDYKAHVEFEMVVSEASNELYFNAVATYSHSTITMGVNPTLSIGLSGGVSIGLVSVGLISHNRDVEFPQPFHYIPD